MAAQPAAPQPAPPGTDIYLLAMPGGLESLDAAAPAPVSAERGYDNQPFFTEDGKAVLFTANRDGKQTDIFEFDRATGRTRPLLSTPEGEYSATMTPGGRGFSVIRVEIGGTQRLWQFDRDGSNPRVVLADVKPVGYHAWIDPDTLALFVLGKPATLQIAKLSTGRVEVVASDIGRSIQRIPGRRAISFVHRETESEVWVKALEPDTKRIERIVKVLPESADRDCAWMPDGTLLMSAGTRLFAWRPGQDGWRQAYDAATRKLGAISRIAVAADGRALAIVVSEPAR